MMYKPVMTDAGLDASAPVSAVDEFCKIRTSYIAAERPLTLYLDKREIVTVMTLGTQPELLILGWLRNQHMVSDIKDIKSIQVDWETDSVAVTTHRPADNIEEKLNKRLADTPLRRIGEPDEVAGLAVFLASKAGGFTTGQTFIIDGGVTCC